MRNNNQMATFITISGFYYANQAKEKIGKANHLKLWSKSINIDFFIFIPSYELQIDHNSDFMV